MAIIHIRNTGQKIEVFEESLVTSLLVILQREGIPIQALCGGRAQCGRCAVRVLQGSEFLTKKREREAVRLDALFNKDGVVTPAPADATASAIRLACQTYTRGDISIEILNLDT